jgi:hypothetical protein
VHQGWVRIDVLRAGIIGKLPMIRQGQMYFMPWQAFPQNNKARRTLGWPPTPLWNGLQQGHRAFAGEDCLKHSGLPDR